MPRASKQSASESTELEGYEGHFEHFPDGYTVGFEPGRTPVLFAGAEIVEFSPTAELQRTIDVVSKNMEAAGS